MLFSYSFFFAMLISFVHSLNATAIPPKPTHSSETPWNAPLADDRSLEFEVTFVSGDEVIVDNTFGWMWQTTPSDSVDWYDAYYHCLDSRVGGYSDWQLPSYYQLVSILKYDQPQRYILPAFKNIESRDVLWSRDDSVAIDQPDYDDRWVLHVKLGLVTFEKRHLKFKALCVRGETPRREGPQGGERFTETSRDVFLNHLTQLKWTAPRNETISKTYMWTLAVPHAEAKEWCEKSNAGGLKSWRLPTIHELYMLLDLNRRNPTSWMPKMLNSMHSIWSSTRKPEFDSWFSLFTMGQMASAPESEKQIFGCVHD